MKLFTKGLIIGSIATVVTTGTVFGVSEYFYNTAVKRKDYDEAAEGKSKRGKLAIKSREPMYKQMENYKLISRANMDFFGHLDEKAISIYAVDGIKLVADLYTVPGEAKGTVIFAHSYRGEPHKDCCSIARYYYEKGYNVLLPYMRGCGKSAGKHITYGVYESVDMQYWAEDIGRRFGKDLPIYLHGISLGASSVLMAVDKNLPENVKGIVADCGFTSSFREFKHLIKNDMPITEFPFLPIFNLYCIKRADFSIRDKDTVQNMMRNTTVPVLFVHGDADSFVPTAMTYENYDACQAKKELLIVPGAAHTMSYYMAPAQYKDAIGRLLEGTLGGE